MECNSSNQQSKRRKSKTRVAQWLGKRGAKSADPRYRRRPRRPSYAAGYAADAKYKVSILPIALPSILTIAADVRPSAWLSYRILNLALI